MNGLVAERMVMNARRRLVRHAPWFAPVMALAVVALLAPGSTAQGRDPVLSAAIHARYSGIAMLGTDDARAGIAAYRIGQKATPIAPATPVPVVREVEIKGFAYIPATIEIPAGDSVTWTNDDNAPHTVTGVDGAVPVSKGLGFGQTFTQEFDTPGTYPYYCAYHPGMKGTVVVR
jgi:plastocyanin